MEYKRSGILLYKCRLCGGIVKNTHVPDCSLALSYIINGTELPWGGAQPSMLTIHTCNTKQTGVADFVGVECDEMDA